VASEASDATICDPVLRVVGFERRVAIAFTVTPTEVTILRFYYGGQNWGAPAPD
jgi:hypothetical protein